MNSSQVDRRRFVAGGVAASLLAVNASPALGQQAKKTRVAIIGCGSVSGAYLPHLTKSPHVEVVSLCDIIPERAKSRGEEFKIANQYPHIEKQLAGVPFDLLVNLTDMQEHEHLNF